MKKKYFSLNRLLIAMGCLLVSGLLFTACKKSNEGAGNTPVSGLMAFNLAPDKPAVGIALSGSNLLQTPLDYTGFSGGYLSIYPGSRNIQAFDSNDSAFATSEYNFQPGRYYSLFVIGNNNHYNNLVVNDNFDSLPSTEGQAYLRYINAIPDSSKPSVNITAGGNSIVNTNAGFSTVSEFVPVTAGDVSVALTNETTINANRTITVESKKVYTILLLGNPAATDSTNKVQIRFISNGSL